MGKGDWLWKLANIDDKNESAEVYVGRFVTVHNPLFFVHELWPKELMQRVIEIILNVMYRQAREKITEAFI